MYETIDIRCPVGAKNLLLKVQLKQESMEVSRDNIILISCRDCTRTSRKEMADSGQPTNFRVIHCFWPDGILESSRREVV